MARVTPQEAELAFFRLLATSGIDLMVQMPVLAPSIHRLFPSFSLSMIRVDEACAPREHYSEHFDEASHQMFASHGEQLASGGDDPADFGRLLRGRVPYGTLIDTSPTYQAGATYQYFFQPNGIHHCLDVAVRSDAGPLGILGIFREQGTRPFAREDVQRVGAIYEHLVHAYEAVPVPADFDEVEGGLLVVDARHRITWASPAARAWLETATPGPDRARLMEHGILPDACQALSRAFQRGHATRSSRTAPASPPTLTLPVAGGRLRLRAYALRAELEPDATPQHIGIQLSLEMHRELRVLRALESMGLPPQQMRIAFRLFRRQPAAEIARDLGVGAETLKSYRRELYTRLGLASAEELRAELERCARGVTLDLKTQLPRRVAG
jgi:DNA-binding CsgD family transcriptional regulator